MDGGGVTCRFVSRPRRQEVAEGYVLAQIARVKEYVVLLVSFFGQLVVTNGSGPQS